MLKPQLHIIKVYSIDLRLWRYNSMIDSEVIADIYTYLHDVCSPSWPAAGNIAEVIMIWSGTNISMPNLAIYSSITTKE